MYSGNPIQKPGGLDQAYPFLPHPAYFWLTGRRREEEVLLYSKNSGWIEFQKEYGPDAMVWEGPKNDLLVSEPGRNSSELEQYLNQQKFASVYQLGQPEKAAPVTGKAFELRTLMDQTRRVKDEAEIRLIKQIAAIAKLGYDELKQIIKPGISEKEIQIAYEGIINRNGAHGVPYDSIVGSGANAAILHALPTPKLVQENELVLIDAGAEIYDYCVDITRTFASSANLDSRNKNLYQLVLKAQLECNDMAKAGAFWRDVHSHAAIVFTQGLREMGILRGNVQDLIEKEVVSMFFPHGLGHLVGLRVRDTGHEENLEPKKYFGARLRVDIQLEPGHLVTVEPGLYFIKSLLQLPELKEKHRDDINWTELEKWLDVGGVRIEDNILITETGNENLTADIEKPHQI